MNENQGVPNTPQNNEYAGVIETPMTGGMAQTPPMPPQNDNLGVIGVPTETINNEKNKKSKKKFLIGALLILIILGVGLFFVYKKLTSNPITIYENTINNVYNFLHENLMEGKNQEFKVDIMEEPAKLGLDVTLSSTMADLEKFSGYTYALDFAMDYKNKKANLMLDIDEKNTEVINALLSFVNGKGYLKSDKLISKVLDLGEMDIFSEMNLEEASSELENLNFEIDDADYILEFVKNTVISSLDKEKFTVSNADVTINGKDHKLKKVEYLLDQENMDRTIKHIINEAVKDEKLLGIIAKIGEAEVSEIKENLQEVLNEPIDYTGYQNFSIVLYTNGLNVTVAGDFIVASEKLLTFDCMDDKWNILIENETSVLTLNNNGDVTTLSYKESNDEILNAKIHIKDGDVKLELNIKDLGLSETPVGVNAIIELKNNEINKDKISGDYAFSINTSGSTDNINLELNGTYKLEKTSVESINTNEATAIENLTMDEMESFYNNLNSVLDKFGLSDALGMNDSLYEDNTLDTDIDDSSNIFSDNNQVLDVYY